MTRPALFLDLDGVLADFDRGVVAVTGRRPDEQPVASMWRALSRHADFFGSLAFTPDGRDLWDFCAPHRPTILTGLPQGRWAAPQKVRWVAERLGPGVPIITCMTRDKPLHGGPGALLVDDREKTRPPWEAAGGLFILHRNAVDSVAALRALGF